MTARLERAQWHDVGTHCAAGVTASPRAARRARAALAAAQAEVAAVEAERREFFVVRAS